MAKFKLTDNDIDCIKQFEGLRLTAYKAAASEKYHTIGYGHYGSDVSKGMVITESEAKGLLKKDLASTETAINGLDVCKSQDEYLALVDFTFNCGIGNLRKSTLLKYIRRNSTDLLIAREFMKWTRSGGKVLKGLVKRRKWEAERFTGKEIYQDADTLKWFVRK